MLKEVKMKINRDSISECASRRILILLILFVLSVKSHGWQQRVAYDIEVSLDTKTHTLEGKEELKYINNSPDTLKFMWIHLYPNAYRDRSTTFARELEKSGNYRFSFSKEKDRGYIEIRSITSQGEPLRYEVKETEMKVWFPTSLPPNDSITLAIEFLEKIPKVFSRLGRTEKLYELQQWYPKVVVYDEYGWHPDGYHAIGEFYGEFGIFDVYITLPKYMIVGATGELVAPEEEIEMLDSLAICGKELEELKARKKPLWKKFIPSISLPFKKKPKLPEGTKTLHFHAENVHDFAWVCSPDFKLMRDEWDGVTINVLYCKKHEDAWKLVPDYAKDALKYYSEWYGKYPYSVLWVIDGKLRAGGGMEYPNLVIIDANVPGFTRALEMVVMHEIGHQWFYGVLGSNEMDETWLDEGINVFSEVRYMETKYGKERNMFKWPKPLPAFDDRWMNSLGYYLVATNKAERPILTPAHRFADEPVAYWSAQYCKAPWVVYMLQYVVGDSTFDEIMHEYYKRFAYSHPHTKDFIKVAEEISGEELDWFFDEWLTTTKICDYALKSVKREDGKILVKVERKGDIIMPVDILLKTKDGKEYVKRWDGKDRIGDLEFETESKPKYVEVDPEDRILEVNNWNNSSRRKIKFHPMPYFGFPSFDSYQLFYAPWISGNDVDGLRLGLGIGYMQFPDGGPMKGRDNFKVGASYGIKSKKLWYSLGYQTPLYFSKNRTRLKTSVSDEWDEFQSELGFSGRFGKYIVGSPEHRVSFSIGFRELRNIEYCDTLDWETGKTSFSQISYSYKIAKRNLQGTYMVKYETVKPVLGSETDFDKIRVDLKNRIRLTQKMFFNLRFCGGYIAGDPLPQDEFFLFGKLRPTKFTEMIVSRKGGWSVQERFHEPGDGNLVGYLGRHIHNKILLSANLEMRLPEIPFRAFLDFGNVWPDLDSAKDFDLLMDAGIAFKFGPVKFYFPIWVSDPGDGEEEFKFRWALEIQKFGFAF